MVFSYVSLVIQKTLQPTVRWTDSFQIILAATVPAAYVALGWPMPSGSADMTAAWVGYSVVSLILLRLVFFAPYALWREARGEIATLECQMGSPQHRIRMEIEKSLIDDRKAALKFISEYRTDRQDLSKFPNHISEYPEFFGPMSRLMADDRSITAMLDDLERDHARMVLAKKINKSGLSDADISIIDNAIERYSARYILQKHKIQDYLLSK
jgi:hypothetical protein